MSDSFELLMAAYPSIDVAQQDFDKLAAAVADKTVKSDGISSSSTPPTARSK